MPEREIFETRANGKLLLTGEYFVLDGATALAMPVRFGQTLEVKPNTASNKLDWQSKDWDGSMWFNAVYELPYLGVLETSDRSVAEMLASIIRECQRQNHAFLAGDGGLDVQTICDFPRAWGLGTSSTIIAALAKWAGADAYPVLRNTLGGSGYDIACAYANTALLYQLEKEQPRVRAVTFEPIFSENLYFVYLEKKQNSRDGIIRYREICKDVSQHIPEVSQLTEQMLIAENLADFEAVIRAHERLVATALGFEAIKPHLFPDYWGEIKSLGAWGGDFVLASSRESSEATKQYFNNKGFKTVLPWKEMVLPQ